MYKANPPAAQERLSAAAASVSSFSGYGVDYKRLVIIEGNAEFTGVTFKLRGTGATVRTAEKGQTVEVHGTIKPTRSTRASSRPRSPAARSPRSRNDHLHPQASAGPRAGYPARASGTPTRRRQSAGATRTTKPTVYYSYADGSGRFSMPRDTWDASTRAMPHELCERRAPASG